MALTDTAIRLAKAETSDRKLADSKGLYLLVTTTGSKLWRLKYRIDGKEKKLALGSYPEVGLKNARARRDVGRPAAQAGREPPPSQRQGPASERGVAAHTFFGVVGKKKTKPVAAGA